MSVPGKLWKAPWCVVSKRQILPASLRVAPPQHRHRKHRLESPRVARRPGLAAVLAFGCGPCVVGSPSDPAPFIPPWGWTSRRFTRLDGSAIHGGWTSRRFTAAGRVGDSRGWTGHRPAARVSHSLPSRLRAGRYTLRRTRPVLIPRTEVPTPTSGRVATALRTALSRRTPTTQLIGTPRTRRPGHGRCRRDR